MYFFTRSRSRLGKTLIKKKFIGGRATNVRDPPPLELNGSWGFGHFLKTDRGIIVG